MTQSFNEDNLVIFFRCYAPKQWRADLAFRPGHISKCPVTENLGFIEHIVAVWMIESKISAFQEFLKTSIFPLKRC